MPDMTIGQRWWMYVIGSIVVLGAAYLMVDGQLFGYRAHTTDRDSSLNVVHTSSVGRGTQGHSSVPEDVSSTTIASIVRSVQAVAGLEEMVVLPATSGHGYTVSADINLGFAASGNSELAQKIESDTGEFFTGLFTSDQNVVNGEVYFTTDGQIVAFAGLGDHVYQTLATKTDTGLTSFVQTMSEQPTVMQQGANNSWFEMNVTGQTAP